MQTNEIYVIFFTYISTTKSIWFHAFVPSQQKVHHYVTIHYTLHEYTSIRHIQLHPKKHFYNFVECRVTFLKQVSIKTSSVLDADIRKWKGLKYSDQVLRPLKSHDGKQMVVK